jgi:hypothetical protein
MSEVILAQFARGEVSFGPEDIALRAAGLESALTNLDITNRNDPTTTLVAKLRPYNPHPLTRVIAFAM